MTGPKHLWSGDWERESEEAAASRARLTPSAPAASELPPPASTAARRAAPRPRGWMAFAAATAIAIAVAIVLLGGSSSPKSPAPQAAAQAGQATQPFGLTQPTPPVQAAPSQPAVAAVPNQPHVHWLGMEIVAGQNGGVVIETVRIGSVGDQAGLDPGDQIVSVDGHAITTTPQLRGVISGMRPGDQVSITVERGSSVYSTSFPLPQGP
jgi:S1-C subfamily serine protease